MIAQRDLRAPSEPSKGAGSSARFALGETEYKLSGDDTEFRSRLPHIISCATTDPIIPLVWARMNSREDLTYKERRARCREVNVDHRSDSSWLDDDTGGPCDITSNPRTENPSGYKSHPTVSLNPLLAAFRTAGTGDTVHLVDGDIRRNRGENKIMVDIMYRRKTATQIDRSRWMWQQGGRVGIRN
ncbi:hypothetical protein BDM02DRAFT_3127464 [Thelephora ganbajun]|uniref:Uncharacterized protein n=1 Tax=Thelephora ganbajun TaxID=370292 RepID=A0ACB6ZMR0_THEGA|nr:hypothetical protein BDM02DRAFT_3127464 [Thelephora ganbajun]